MRTRTIYLSDHITDLDAFATLDRVGRLLVMGAAVGHGTGESILALFGGSIKNKSQTALTVRCSGFCALVSNHVSACSMLVKLWPHLTLAYARTAACQFESVDFPSGAR